MKFGIDSDGNYGYIKAGADSVTPFSSANSVNLVATATNSYTATENFGSCLLELRMTAYNYNGTTLNGKTINPIIDFVASYESGWNQHHKLYLVTLKSGDVINTIASSLTQDRNLKIWQFK